MALLQGKVAIVTGCSSGIGLATTKLFLDSGARVFGIDISLFPSSLAPFASTSFHFHQADLLQPSAADEAVASCVERYGPNIDVLANVAGIMDNYECADSITNAAWERVMGINATVPVRLMRAVLLQGGMKARRTGSIINVASKSGVGGAAAGIAYTASKHALVGATKNVAWRFRNEGIRCNAVCPGAIATNIGASMSREEMDVEAYLQVKPVHELHRAPGTPQSITADDVANAILFLASNLSTKVSGSVLPIDKAWSTV